MTISASLVKELRERTGQGMMECKKALVEANGDVAAAIVGMRKAGIMKAAKKSTRITAEGMIAIHSTIDNKRAAIIEVNCETDFVARDENFKRFINQVAEQVLETGKTNIAELNESILANANGQTVDQLRQQLVTKIGENIQLRRAEVLTAGQGIIGHYKHGDRIGVLIHLNTADDILAKDLCMHIAANRPIAIAPENVSQTTLDREKEIYVAQAQKSGKPAEIIEKMITGRLNKYLSEVTLLGQPFVKNPDQKVADLLKQANAAVMNFVRYEVGEGIEKKTENFAAEVMSQVNN